MPIFSMTQIHTRISELVARLAELERERAEIVTEINSLRSVDDARTAAAKMVPLGRAGDPTDRNSPIESKIALFRRLFGGRSDVFPVRWENRSTGRSGYAPACAHHKPTFSAEIAELFSENGCANRPRERARRSRGARLIGCRCKLRLDLSNLLPDEIDHKTRAWREMPSR
jgi:hypothetical protein